MAWRPANVRLTCSGLVALSWIPLIASDTQAMEDRRRITHSEDEVRSRTTLILSQIRSLRIAFHTLPDPSRNQAQVWVNMQQMRPNLLSNVTRHSTSEMPPQDDPFAIRCVVYPQHYIYEELFNRTWYSSKLSPDAEMPGSLSREFWCNATGNWLVDDRPSPTLYGVHTSLELLFEHTSLRQEGHALQISRADLGQSFAMMTFING